MLQAKLLVVVGRASSSAIELKLPVTIGRDDKVWLRLKHPTISRKHCELSEVDGKIVVRDCGSSNGTLVDGKLIKEEAVLEPGHTLTVGPLTFEAQYETSANGNGQIGLSDAAQEQPDPSAATMLGAPDFTSLTAPEVEEPQPEVQAEAPQSPAAETDEASLDLDSIDEDDFSLSFDEEDELPAPTVAERLADVADDESPAVAEEPEAKQAEVAPESGNAESEFELDFDLDEESQVSDSLETEPVPKADNDAVSSVEDDDGVTIEADSDAISDLELDSDFALTLESEAPPAPVKPEAEQAEPEEALAEEEAPLTSEDDEPETTASVTEDIENVRDFSGPVADMPSQILFSVDEIEEPLVEPSDEDSAIEDESKAEAKSEANDQIELESLSLDLEDEPVGESDSEPASSIDSTEDDLSLEADEFSLSDPEPVSTEVDAADRILEEETASDEALTQDDTPEPSVEPEASAEEDVSDDLDLMLDAEDTPAEPVELPQEPVSNEAADSSFAISLDDDEDTADGDLSDITDVAEPPPAKAETTSKDNVEAVAEDSLSDLDLGLDDLDSARSESLGEFELADDDFSAPNSPDEALPAAQDEASDELDDFSDSAELQWTDPKLAADRSDAEAAKPESEPEADLDLSEMALEALDNPIDLASDEISLEDKSASSDATDEAENAEFDLSEMALDAVGEPENDTVDTAERVENATEDEAESSDLDLSQMAFEALDNSTTDEPSPVIAAEDDADSLDLSELALGELDEPSAEAAPEPAIEAADSGAVEEDELDAMIAEVDFSSADDEVEENSVDLASDADSQVDSLDLSEMAFEVAETSPTEASDSAKPPALDLPEFELDAAEDSSESEAGLPPIDLEPAVEDEGSELFREVDLDATTPATPNLVDESSSASDEFEVPELSGDINEGAVAEAAAPDSPIEVPSDSASDVDSDDFSAFDFGSDEDQSSEFSMEDASVAFDLPGNSEGSSSASDAETPKKKRSWWPFARKAKKKKQETVEAADEVAPVEPVLNENLAHKEVVPEDEIVNLDAVDFEADEEEEFDTAALADEPAAESNAEEVAEISFNDEELVSFELPEPEVVAEDEPSSDLVDDLLFEDEDAEEVDFAAVKDSADEPAAVEVKAADEEDLGIFDAVESDEAASSGELEVPTFEDDDASSVVSFDAIKEQATADDEASVAEIEVDFKDDDASLTESSAVSADAEENADTEDDLDEISFLDADETADETTGGVSSEAGDRDDLDVPSFDDDEPSFVSFEADDEEPVTAEEAVAPEIDFDEEPVESSPSASTAEKTPPTAKAKRGFWPFGKKKTADLSAKQKVKAPKKKRGWGFGKKKSNEAAEDEPVEQPVASELDVPTFEEEPVAFEPQDENDPFVAPGDSADDDAMAFLVESSDDQDEVPDFAALDEDKGNSEDEESSSISADDDSDEFLKQLDL